MLVKWFKHEEKLEISIHFDSNNPNRYVVYNFLGKGVVLK